MAAHETEVGFRRRLISPHDRIGKASAQGRAEGRAGLLQLIVVVVESWGRRPFVVVCLVAAID
jgi:hypothetical protein